MSNDVDPLDDDLDAWIAAEAAKAAHVRTVDDALAEKPVGTVVDYAGRQFCLIARGANSGGDAGRKDELSRRELVLDLNKRMALVGPSTVHAVHEWVAQVHQASPWMAPISEYLMNQAEQRVRTGLKHCGFNPVMIHGDPGIGKTHYARHLADSAGVPALVMDGASMLSVFQVSGVERGWSSGNASPLVRHISNTGVANPIVIIDEIEKVGVGGSGGSPQSALLGMVDRASAKEWRCPYTELTIDLSRVSWVFTANDISAVSAPMKDRCRVIRADAPTAAQIADYVRSRLSGQDPQVIRAATDAVAGKSMRVTSRVIDAVIAAGKRPLLN